MAVSNVQEFLESLQEVIEELDEDNETVCVFIELEQHTLLVSDIEERNGNIYLIAGKSVGKEFT